MTRRTEIRPIWPDFSTATADLDPWGRPETAQNRPFCVLVVLLLRSTPMPTGGLRLRYRPPTNGANRRIRWGGRWAPWGGGWARALHPKIASVCLAHISASPVTASPPTRNTADSDEAMISYYDTAHSNTHAHPPFALCWASARRRGGRGCRWIWVYERPAEAQTRRARP